MKFAEKYTIESEKSKEDNKDKKVISDDAFAIGDVIQSLVDKIEQLRMNFTR